MRDATGDRKMKNMTVFATSAALLALLAVPAMANAEGGDAIPMTESHYDKIEMTIANMGCEGDAVSYKLELLKAARATSFFHSVSTINLFADDGSATCISTKCGVSDGCG